MQGNRLVGNTYILKPINSTLQLKLLMGLNTITHEYLSNSSVKIVTYHGTEPVKSEELSYSIDGNNYKIDDEVYDLSFRNDTIVLSINGSEYIDMIPAGNQTGKDEERSNGDNEPSRPVNQDSITSNVNAETHPKSDTANFDIALPNPPVDGTSIKYKTLITDLFRKNGGTQQGVIYKVFNDEEGNSWFTVCYKDRLDELPYHGYVLIDVMIEPTLLKGYDPESNTTSDDQYLKNVLVPGRRIDYQDEVVGTGSYRHTELVYLHPQINSVVTVTNPVRIEKYLRWQ